MLVLSRKPKESIVINGNVTVSVLRVDNEMSVLASKRRSKCP